MDKEQEAFLKDLEPVKGDDLFEQPIAPTGEIVEDTTSPREDEDRPNRRERRLMSKLQAERESGIALAARLETLTEAQKLARDSAPSESDEIIERIYGTNTPEGAEATRLLQAALKSVSEKARDEAIEAFRAEQREAQTAVQNEEQNLDEMLEELEDEYNVDLTSKNAEQMRQGFFTLLERLSPKDRDGNVLQYADHHAVWEELQERQKRSEPNRAKSLSARSMTQTGASAASTAEQDATERYLKENGII